MYVRFYSAYAEDCLALFVNVKNFVNCAGGFYAGWRNDFSSSDAALSAIRLDFLSADYFVLVAAFSQIIENCVEVERCCVATTKENFGILSVCNEKNPITVFVFENIVLH